MLCACNAYIHICMHNAMRCNACMHSDPSSFLCNWVCILSFQLPRVCELALLQRGEGCCAWTLVSLKIGELEDW